jgi:hypothetical protein
MTIKLCRNGGVTNDRIKIGRNGGVTNDNKIMEKWTSDK